MRYAWQPLLQPRQAGGSGGDAAWSNASASCLSLCMLSCSRRSKPSSVQQQMIAPLLTSHSSIRQRSRAAPRWRQR